MIENNHVNILPFSGIVDDEFYGTVIPEYAYNSAIPQSDLLGNLDSLPIFHIFENVDLLL